MATIFGALPFILQNGTVADASQVMSDFNKVISDGNANAAENGVNSSITALLGLTTPIPVAGGSSTHFIGSASTGTAAAQVIATTTPANWTLTNGFEISFTPGFSSVAGGITLAVGGGAALAVRKPSPAGPIALAANDWVAGQMATVVYDGTAYLTQSEIAYPALFAAQTTLASAVSGVTDLGTIPSQNILITGVNAITSFGTTALVTSPIYLIEFQSSLKLTYNATSMMLPGGNDIQTQASDFATAMYMGSGNWQIMEYTRALPVPGVLPTSAGFKNLIARATADTVLSFTADELMLHDVSGREFKLTSVSLSNTITGTGANGLDTGTLSGPNLYAVYAIYNALTVTQASLISLSATAPTLPPGYTFFMRVGWVFYAAANRLYRSVQQGRSLQIVPGTFPAAVPNIVNGAAGNPSNSSPTLASVSLSGIVPTTAAKVYLGGSNVWKGGSPANVLIAPNTAWGGTNNGPQGSNGNIFHLWLTGGSIFASRCEMVLEALSFAWASDAAGGAVSLLGWEDNL